MKRKVRLLSVILLLAMVIGLPSLVGDVSADSNTQYVVKLIFNNDDVPTGQEFSDAGFRSWWADEYYSVSYRVVVEALGADGNRDTSVSGDYTGASFTNGVSEPIPVGHGEETWLLGLPEGTTLSYISCELLRYGYSEGACPADWAYKPNIASETVVDKDIVIIDPNIQPEGYATWHDESLLLIELELTDKDGNPLSGTYGPGMEFSNGKLVGGINYSYMEDNETGERFYGWEVNSSGWIEDASICAFPKLFFAIPENAKLRCTNLYHYTGSELVWQYTLPDIVVYPPENVSYTVTYTVDDPQPATYKEGKGIPGQQSTEPGTKVYIADNPETDETTYTEYGTTKNGEWSFIKWGVPTDAESNELEVLEEPESGRKYFIMPESNVVIRGSWRFAEAVSYNVTYVVEGDAPATFFPALSSYNEPRYEGDTVPIYAPLSTEEGEKDGVRGKWRFNGWSRVVEVNDDGTEGAEISIVTDADSSSRSFVMPAHNVRVIGSWTFMPTFTVLKLPQGGEASEGLSGAVFTLTETETGAVYTLTTGEDGRGQVNLPAGSYHMVETTAPAGYKLSAEEWWFTVYEHGGIMMGPPGEDSTSVFFSDTATLMVYDELQANTHKVTYVYKGTVPAGAPEVPTEQTEVAYGTEVTIAANPTLTGYTFSGWKYDSYGAGDTFSMPDEDVVIEGEWKANTHKVTYVYKGTVPAGAPEVPAEQTEVAYGTEVTIAANPTLTGYTFSGWKYGTYGAGDTFSMPDEDVVIEGEWKANTHKVTYVYKGTVPAGAPEVPAEQTEVAYGTEVTIAANPTLTGYTFSGWKYDSYGAGDTFSMPDADVVIEGGWRVNEYTVIYAPGEQGRWNAADETTSGLHYGDKTPDVKVDPTAEANHNPGYEFDGWDKDIASTVTESVTYTAKWKAIEYTVIYAPGEQGRWNAADETTSGLHYGDPMPVVKADPNTEHNPGYTFAGWEPQIDESVTRTITYVAQWLRIEEKKYTVSYEYIGTVPVGAPVPPTAQTYAPGAEVKVADAPTLNGYKFSGWDHSDFTMPEDNVVIRGSWTAVPKAEVIETVYYILHYESNGGTEYADERYSANTKVELTKMPTREGYIFTGWHADAALREMIDHVVMDGSKTVYAGWERVSTPAVNKVDHIAYIIGYPNGMVYPEANITRAEVATIFFRLLRDDVRAANVTSNNNYPDVSMGSWYNVAVSTMSRIGVIKGYPDGTFRPGANITRAEFAAIAARFDEKEVGVMADFSDILGHWAAMEISKAASNGWVNGYPDGTFRPDREITRAESMALINRVLERDPESEEDLLEGMITWHDNADKSKWYYVDVQEATNSHDYEHKTNGHERWLQINSIPDWTAYQR